MAPVHVVVGMREESYHERYRKPDKLLEDGSEIDWHVPWWWVDAGKAMMLLLLAAIDEGLGAGLFGLFPAEHNELLREELGCRRRSTSSASSRSATRRPTTAAARRAASSRGCRSRRSFAGSTGSLDCRV